MKKNMTVQELIVKLQTEYNSDDLVLGVLYFDEDIQACAEGLEIELSPEQIKNVMEFLERKYDSEYGIDNERIQDAILELYPQYQ